MHQQHTRVSLRALCLALACVVVAVTGIRTAAGPLAPYHVRRVVAEVLGGPQMVAADVNNAGEVLATRLEATGTEAMRWRAGLWQGLGAGSQGQGLSDLPFAAGQAGAAATVWDAAGTPMRLPPLSFSGACTPTSWAEATSGAGHVVGGARCGDVLRALFWPSFATPPTVVAPPPGYGGILLRDVNRFGAVTGYTDGTVVRGFVWQHGLHRLVPVTGASLSQSIWPAAISDSGYVTGVAAGVGPFLWDGAAAASTPILWKSGFTGRGDDVNDQGVVAGSLTPDRAPANVFVWHRDFGLVRLAPPAGALPASGYCDGASLSDISATDTFEVVATCHDYTSGVQLRVVRWAVSLARTTSSTPRP
jgi:hypothetical protein